MAVENIVIDIEDNTGFIFPNIPGFSLNFFIPKGTDVEESILELSLVICKAYYKKGYRVKLDYSYLMKEIKKFSESLGKVETEEEIEGFKSKLNEFFIDQIQDNIRIEYY